MAFLVFQLYGDMASWGDIAVGEQRPSHAYPTKSAILGLLCAAQGITRDEDEAMVQLNAEVKMAIQIFHRGHFLTDYHTIQAAPQVALKKKAYTRKEELEALSRYQAAGSGNSGTILSSREYRMEAYYRVALQADPERLRIVEASLKEPAFVLYLGRKACPLALPLAPYVSDVSFFEDAFDDYVSGSSRASEPKVSAALEKILTPLRGLGGESEYIWEEGCLTQLKFKKKTVMRSIPISRQRWQFQDQPIFHGYRELNHVY